MTLVGSRFAETMRFEDRLDHVEIVLADVGQRELDVGELRHAQNVGEELPGEADAAGADDGDLEAAHVLSPFRLACGYYAKNGFMEPEKDCAGMGDFVLHCYGGDTRAGSSVRRCRWRPFGSAGFADPVRAASSPSA